MDLKTCTKCKTPKPIEEFGNKRLGRGGKNPWCKLCLNAYTQGRAIINRESIARKRRVAYHANPKKLEAGREYRKKYPERSRASSKRWRDANKDRVKLRQQRWNEKHPGRLKALQKAWYESHKDWVLERSRKWAAKNKEKIHERVRKWQKANLAKLANNTSQYRSRKKGVAGSHTLEEWLALCKKFKNRCVRCGKKRKLEADHIVPLSKPGATDYISNIQPLCRTCNTTKGNRNAIDYRDTPFTEHGQVRLLG